MTVKNNDESTEVKQISSHVLPSPPGSLSALPACSSMGASRAATLTAARLSDAAVAPSRATTPDDGRNANTPQHAAGTCVQVPKLFQKWGKSENERQVFQPHVMMTSE